MVEITQASYISDYTIRFVFSDGSSNDVDFGPFLADSQNPMITRFRNVAKFKKFRVEHGRSVVWGDYTMAFAVESLYKTAPIVKSLPTEIAEKWLKAVS